jgi:hypothetical protein
MPGYKWFKNLMISTLSKLVAGRDVEWSILAIGRV